MDAVQLVLAVVVREVVANAVLRVTIRSMHHDVVDAHVLLLEVLPVAQRAHAHAVTLHLARVGWTNAALRRTDLHVSAVQLVDAVANLVEVEHDVGTIRDEQSADEARYYYNYLFSAVMVFFFSASISSKRVKMFTTHPLPMMHLAWG